MSTSWFNTEDNLSVSMQSNCLIIKNTIKQKPLNLSLFLYLQFMYKPVIVKRKIKISVQIWVRSMMSLEGGLNKIHHIDVLLRPFHTLFIQKVFQATEYSPNLALIKMY